MKYKRDPICYSCGEWQLNNYLSVAYICLNCNDKIINRMKRTRFNQNKLERRIFEMVKILSKQEIERLSRINMEIYCHHCHDKPEPAIVPFEPPVTTDSIIVRRRRGKH